MANFTLSFNKVAAGLHFSGVKGVRVRVEGGNAQFQPTNEYAEDVYRLEERTRGGLEIRFKGTAGDLFLSSTGFQPGDHMVLSAIRNGWITTQRHVPTPEQEKPSKIWPSARIWTVVGASEYIEAAPGFSFKPKGASDEQPELLLFESEQQGVTDAEIAKIKTDLLALHRWCAANCGSDWAVAAKQSVFFDLVFRDRGLSEVREKARFHLTLRVAPQYGPLVQLTFV